MFVILSNLVNENITFIFSFHISFHHTIQYKCTLYFETVNLVSLDGIHFLQIVQSFSSRVWLTV